MIEWACAAQKTQLESKLNKTLNTKAQSNESVFGQRNRITGSIINH